MDVTTVRRALTVVLAGAALSGCVLTRRPARLTAEQEQVLKARLGRIATAAASFEPALTLKTPAKGAVDAAGKGALGGAGAMFDAASKTSDGAGAVVGLALTPVAAVVGGVGGAILSDSAADVESRESAIRAALAEMKVQQTMRERLLEEARGKTVLDFVSDGAAGPDDAAATADYRPLKAKGVDTVQESAVLGFGLDGEGRVQPDLALTMRLRLRVVRTEDGAVLYERVFVHSSPKRKFAQWAAEGSRLFRAELESAYRALAARAVHEAYFLDALMR